MKSFLIRIASLALALLSASALAAPGFNGTPQITDNGNSVTISFSVTEYTDVTVEAVDAAGKRIAAIAGGKLGPNPPAPLTANSLTQTLTWNKQTDAGQPAAAGWRVRVGLGMTANFDRVYGWDGRADLKNGGRRPENIGPTKSRGTQ